jgi:hypothetical protein
MSIHNLPIRHKQSGDPHTFVGWANPKPSESGGRRLVIYTNVHGALFYQEIHDFIEDFEWHNGLPIVARMLF